MTSEHAAYMSCNQGWRQTGILLAVFRRGDATAFEQTKEAAVKPATRRVLDDLPMRKFMIAVGIIGLIVVPILWVEGYLTWAIATLLVVTLLILQAALIDLPGLTYKQLHKLWGKPGKSNGAAEDESSKTE